MECVSCGVSDLSQSEASWLFAGGWSSYAGNWLLSPLLGGAVLGAGPTEPAGVFENEWYAALVVDTAGPVFVLF